MSAPTSPIRIGIVAGETSGDLLGAGLMRALKARLPRLEFEGIGGPAMQAEGCVSLFPMEPLSLIGFEALGEYPALVRLRRRLARHFLSRPPDIYIGVDVPDFNLTLEQRLRSAGVRTVHYVSPTVWAWRRWRMRKIRRAVDHMLVLFPFEAEFYRRQGIPVTFVGHPLADLIEENYDPAAARARLGLPRDRTVVALLPGSRSRELMRHADLFVATALWLRRRRPGLHFVAPFVNGETMAVFQAALNRQGAGDLPVTLLRGRSREAMAAADVVLLASGTATLEAALLKKPMVVTYKVSLFSYLLIRLFSHVSRYSLPNNLAGREIVPEFLQYNATPEKLGAAVEHYLGHPEETTRLRELLSTLHRDLRQNASDTAADAVLGLLPKTTTAGSAAANG